MSDGSVVEQAWLPVIGRALAQICMHSADLGGKTIAERARFLKALGLELSDIAQMLDTSSASVRELLRVAKNKKGSKHVTRKKARK